MGFFDNFTKGFFDGLVKIIDKPPYLIFVFVGALFVGISLIAGDYFKETWAFFIYSSVGSIWRYIEKDMTSPIKEIFKRRVENKKAKVDRSELWIRGVYHLGNIGLLVGLFFYLDYLIVR